VTNAGDLEDVRVMQHIHYSTMMKKGDEVHNGL
jgi:hypothetical protein